MSLTKDRYTSLDVLRGLTIALMIIVNTPGSWSTIYEPFEHSAWHGFTITDLVFPTFLFVVGNSMSFSLKKYTTDHSSFIRKLVIRSLLIFFIGVFLNAFPFIFRSETGNWQFINLQDVRIPGVLQRIALCYFIAGLLIHFLKTRSVLVVSAILLLGYWAVMYFFGDAGDPYALEHNAELKLDLAIFRPENIYHGYGIPFDPEGILSTIPAVVNVIAGYFTGLFIQRSKSKNQLFLTLLIAGILACIVAKVWDIWFPINKPIWTSSYVIYTVGWDLLILSFLILIIELLHFKKWTYFFEVFGRNPLFIYILSGIIITVFGLIPLGDSSLQGYIYTNAFLSWLTPYNASLLFAISYMLLLWLIGWFMDRKSIYIKV